MVIGEITCGHMIVVLNKTDLIEEPKREAQIAKVSLSFHVIHGSQHLCKSAPTSTFYTTTIGRLLMTWFNDCVSGQIVNPIIAKVDPVLFIVYAHI